MTFIESVTETKDEPLVLAHFLRNTNQFKFIYSFHYSEIAAAHAALTKQLKRTDYDTKRDLDLDFSFLLAC